MLRALLVWLVMVIGAIANGTFRNAVLEPRLGMGTAHVISTILLCAIIIVITWYFFTWMRIETPSRAWLVGLLWLGATVAFEFGFGHWVVGKSWEVLMTDYDITTGRIWVLVLIVTVSAPRIVQRFR